MPVLTEYVVKIKFDKSQNINGDIRGTPHFLHCHVVLLLFSLW
jgi:hypothetical protein